MNKDSKMDIQVAPLRTLDDFILGESRFQVPDLQNIDRWFNRIVNNLLYYQTNYILSALVIFLLVTIGNPHHMLYGIITMGLVFGLMYYSSSNNAQVAEFKQNHPFIVMMGSLFIGYYFILQIGCVSVFMFGVALPVMFIILHSSLRLRNLKNKAANIADVLGVAKRTPMGIFLREWGIEPNPKFIS
ncbi:PRA1 family protein 3 [Eurytemora carolleeae]|uniref:PRA1 family protein 3 n=1 Tax=Eurytemora carolleeae TaxID=1294199 RepID=UPI000C76BE4E|nr:PRA1 family protein 3 [Eurytemora carolleeae]|eukprot:XP_023336137.1 PRA1 family protein 3-like [Eurytemora affinis]